MKILNFGSLNIDHVYRVDHFVRPGETLAGGDYRRFAGGKGANQSMALACAGAHVCHAGKLGADGAWMKERLDRCGVDTSFVVITDGPSGHAIIQVNPEGENAIIIEGGVNRQITEADVERVLPHFAPGDYLLLQNEISSIPEIMTRGAGRGLRVVLNPAPMRREVLDYPLHLVSCFVVNEIEGGELTGEDEPERILQAMAGRYAQAATVLTLGDKGAIYKDRALEVHVAAVKVEAVDTTAAGDTFIGYFLADLMLGRSVENALRTACKAAAICVTRPGAADSIPRREELGP